jgi:NDP-sugar pyrophosphorylase family protein
MVRTIESPFYPIFKSDINSLQLGPDLEAVWKRLCEKFETPEQLQRALVGLLGVWRASNESRGHQLTRPVSSICQEDTAKGCCFVHPQADVSPNAIVVGSLVYPSARIQDRSVVLRSIIGPGCSIGASVVNRSVLCNGVIAVRILVHSALIGKKAVVIDSSLMPSISEPLPELPELLDSLRDQHNLTRLPIGQGSGVRSSGPIVGSNAIIVESTVVGPVHISPAQRVYRGGPPK